MCLIVRSQHKKLVISKVDVSHLHSLNLLLLVFRIYFLELNSCFYDIPMKQIFYSQHSFNINNNVQVPYMTGEGREKTSRNEALF